MNGFNIESRIRYRSYRHIRFQEGMPRIQQSYIELGHVVRVPIEWEELQIDLSGWMRYRFEWKKDMLHEYLVFLDGEKTLHMTLISVGNEKEESFFMDKIYEMLPVYAYGKLLFSTSHPSADYKPTVRLFEYLDQVYDGTDVCCRYQQTSIRLERGREEIDVHVNERGEYLLTPRLIESYLQEGTVDPGVIEWIEDIQDILRVYQGFYVAEEKESYGILSHPTETWRKSIVSLYELLFDEPFPEDVYEVMKNIRYQRTLRAVAIYMSEAETADWLLERTAELLQYEQHIQKWLNTYDYEEFLFRKEPYHVDF